jgi:hypothetical protein
VGHKNRKLRKNICNKEPRCREAKRQLIENYGCVCFLCRKDVGRSITWHHVKPRYASGDDSYENGSLLCEKCHVEVHRYNWGTAIYNDYMTKVLWFKNTFKPTSV